MSIQKFIAATSREAMRLVREALGEDALILSNRTTPEGVEVLALAEDEQQQLVSNNSPEPTLAPKPAPSMETRPSPPPVQPSAPRPNMMPPISTPARPTAPPPRPAPNMAASTPPSMGYHQAASLAAYAAQTPPPAPRANEGVDFAALSERLLGEMQDMRALLNQQLQAPNSKHPHAALQQRLLGAGFGPQLCHELLNHVPSQWSHPSEAEAWLARQLAARLHVQQDESELLDAGGVIALVGPTGVGKTTTTAKLAARYVMRHGAQDVALVTTDSFRIGAHEQLRIYARLLGVEVHALAADAPLDGLLNQLANKRLIIIDTVGMSQRDQRLLIQIQQLGAIGRPLRLLLLLNAASHGDTLEEVVDTYQRAARAAGAQLSDCIVSKCDEAARLGSVLDILMRHGLCLRYLSVGQQVPEDLQPADAQLLVEQALSASQASPFVPEHSLASAPQRLDNWARNLLSQSRGLSLAMNSLRQEIDGFALLEQLWQLNSLPQALQAERWADCMAQYDATQPVNGPQQLLWGKAKAHNSVTWNLPLFVLDRQGHVQLRPWLAHQLPIGVAPRLQWAEQQLQACWHSFASQPDHATRQQLTEQGVVWSFAAKGSSRVEYQRERYSLQQLVDVSEPHSTLTLRQRGRTLNLELLHLPVRFAGNEVAVHAWFTRVTDADSGHVLPMRYNLVVAPIYLPLGEQAEGLRRQWIHDELASLTVRAWQSLGDIHGPAQQELRLSLASALAACAYRLEQTDAPWAVDARAQLLGLMPGRRSRGVSQSLEALLHLLTAGDAFRQLGGAQG